MIWVFCPRHRRQDESCYLCRTAYDINERQLSRERGQ